MNKQSKKTKKHHANIHEKVQRMSALNYDTEVKVRLKKKKLKKSLLWTRSAYGKPIFPV